MRTLSRSLFFCLACCLFICPIGLGSTQFAALAQEDTSWQTKFLPKEKEDELKQKAERMPDDAKLQFQLSDAYIEAERWADAASALERLVQLKPDSAVAHHYLGECYGYLGRHEDAVLAFQKAAASKSLELFGEKVRRSEPLGALAAEYEELQRYDEAIATWNEVLRRNPSDKQPLYKIGLVYIAQGKREEAAQLASQLLSYQQELLLKELASPSSKGQPGADVRQPVPTPPANSQPEQMTNSLRPTILYRERASYSHFARVKNIQGSVLLQVVYYSDGRIGNVKVIRPLPYGLTTEAIKAVKKIRFQPGRKDGNPVSVRGNVEFNFTLY